MTQYIKLTVASEDDGEISALEITQYDDGAPCGGREAFIAKSAADDFVADCIGWSEPAITYDDGTPVDKAERFEQGHSVELQIRPVDWVSWLTAFEVVDEQRRRYPSGPMRDSTLRVLEAAQSFEQLSVCCVHSQATVAPAQPTPQS